MGYEPEKKRCDWPMRRDWKKASTTSSIWALLLLAVLKLKLILRSSCCKCKGWFSSDLLHTENCLMILMNYTLVDPDWFVCKISFASKQKPSSQALLAHFLVVFVYKSPCCCLNSAIFVVWILLSLLFLYRFKPKFKTPSAATGVNLDSEQLPIQFLILLPWVGLSLLYLLWLQSFNQGGIFQYLTATFGLHFWAMVSGDKQLHQQHANIVLVTPYTKLIFCHQSRDNNHSIMLPVRTRLLVEELVDVHHGLHQRHSTSLQHQRSI